MRSLIAALFCALCWPLAASTETSASNPRVGLTETWDSRVHVSVQLDRAVPWRAFTVDNPPRGVLELKGVDWPEKTVRELEEAGAARSVMVSAAQPGWSRLVIDLEGALALEEAAMEVAEEGAAGLTLTFEPVTKEAFAAIAGAPDNVQWNDADTTRSQSSGSDGLLVVIDPGHGGRDTGAVTQRVTEKDLMLDVAQRLAAALEAQGIEVRLTREGDQFVSLDARVIAAQRAKADLFLSLHADRPVTRRSKGVTIYTLSETAAEGASTALSERHARSDILVGLDMTGRGDALSDVLIDLARQQTAPRSEALAQALHDALLARDVPLNTRPLRKAGFATLKSADIPSVRLNLGVLDVPRDFANLTNEEWQANMAAAIAEAVVYWKAQNTHKQETTLRQ